MRSEALTMQTDLVVVAVAIYLLYLCWQRRGRGQLPPGPWTFPLLGSIPYLRQDRYRQLATMGRRYGGLFTIYFGSTPAVIITDWSIMKEALVKQASIFAGRPASYVCEAFFEKRDIAFSEMSTWKQLRPFTVRHLKDLGFGKNILEESIRDEADKSVKNLKNLVGKKVTIDKTFSISVINITWQVITGHKFDLEDSQLEQFAHDITSVTRAMERSAILDAFPFLSYILPNCFSFKRGLECCRNADRIIYEEIRQHEKKNYGDNNPPSDFIDIFLGEIHKRGPVCNQRPPFNGEHLVGIIRDLFFAGMETMDTSLTWAILLVTKFPRAQLKVHEEIDRIIGSDRQPDYNDRKNMPYVMAVLAEMNRFITIVPMSLPHATTKTTTLCGYTIPKGTMVLPNLWAVHHDPVLWGDPEHFRPERFLDDFGQFKEPEYLIPFSAGPRICLGEKVAKVQLFVFFCTFLQHLSFAFPPEEPEPTLNDISSLVTRPLAYSVIPQFRK